MHILYLFIKYLLLNVQFKMVTVYNIIKITFSQSGYTISKFTGLM